VTTSAAQRATRRYHHGNLANALVEAGTALARAGGPRAVVLREVAREVGVSPTSAYRHFAHHGALLAAVRDSCQASLAASMRSQLKTLPAEPDPRLAARGRMLAVGRGYLAFAFAEPGLFRTAFAGTATDTYPPPDGIQTGEPGPYELLSAALDELVTQGELAPERRQLAEIGAWAAVHGLALLVLDGPLWQIGADERATAVERILSMVLDGV